MDAFENLTFLTRYHPNVDISSDSESELESKIEQPRENIAERTKLRRQRFDEIAER